MNATTQKNESGTVQNPANPANVAVGTIECYGVTLNLNDRGGFASREDAKKASHIAARMRVPQQLADAAAAEKVIGFHLDSSKDGNIVELVKACKATGGAYTFTIDGVSVTPGSVATKPLGRSAIEKGLLSQ